MLSDHDGACPLVSHLGRNRIQQTRLSRTPSGFRVSLDSWLRRNWERWEFDRKILGKLNTEHMTDGFNIYRYRDQRVKFRGTDPTKALLH